MKLTSIEIRKIAKHHGGYFWVDRNDPDSSQLRNKLENMRKKGLLKKHIGTNVDIIYKLA